VVFVVEVTLEPAFSSQGHHEEDPHEMLLTECSCPCDPDSSLERLARQALADLGREYLLNGPRYGDFWLERRRPLRDGCAGRRGRSTSRPVASAQTRGH